MLMNILQQQIDEKGYLLADGATGTNLFAMGLISGDAPELWNKDEPEKIRNLYRIFIDAGSDLILTNSFGGNRYRLKLHNAQDRVTELNSLAASIAREEADKESRKVLVAGSMGPTGELIQPLGELSIEDCEQAFFEQAQALVEGGADVLWIETMSAQDELEAAIRGASKTGYPVAATLSLDTNGNTMMGISPRELVNICNQHNLAGFGTNCGVGASEVVASIISSSQENPNAPLIAKANCGIPEFIDGEVTYNGTPELMADYAVMVRDAGAKIIGGCCGTTAAHIASMRAALDSNPVSSVPTLEAIEQKLGEVSAGAKSCYHGQESAAANAQPRGGRRRRRSSATA